MDNENWPTVVRPPRTKLLLKLGALFVLVYFLSGCTQTCWGSVPPTLKIGLVAPFEGLHRPLGYEVLFAVKLALQERNVWAGQGYQVELVALNDFDDPAEAARQAKALVSDPQVVGIIGHLSSAATAAAVPVYQVAEMAVIVPWTVEAGVLDSSPGVVSLAAESTEAVEALESFGQAQGFSKIMTWATYNLTPLAADTEAIQLRGEATKAGEIIVSLKAADISLPLFGEPDIGSPQVVQVAKSAANGLIFASPGPAPADLPDGLVFTEAYEALAGFPPGPRAVLAYDAAQVLLDALDQATIKTGGPPTRADIRGVIGDIQHRGLSGEIIFDEKGRRQAASVWIYQISREQYPGVLLEVD